MVEEDGAGPAVGVEYAHGEKVTEDPSPKCAKRMLKRRLRRQQTKRQG